MKKRYTGRITSYNVCYTKLLRNTASRTDDSQVVMAEGEYDYGAKTALETDELTIEQMLSYAIQDEYLARLV